MILPVFTFSDPFHFHLYIETDKREARKERPVVQKEEKSVVQEEESEEDIFALVRMEYEQRMEMEEKRKEEETELEEDEGKEEQEEDEGKEESEEDNDKGDVESGADKDKEESEYEWQFDDPLSLGALAEQQVWMDNRVSHWSIV